MHDTGSVTESPDRLGHEPVNAVERRFLLRVLGQVRSLDNALRGLYAEELVASYLPKATTREGWTGWDIDWRGIRIEVKTTGHHQSWHRPETPMSMPRWDIPERRAWDPGTDTFSEHQRRHADVYVLCLHTSRHLAEGWSFYVVPTVALDRLGQKSIRLRSVETLAGEAVPGPRLPIAIEGAARRQHDP